MSFSQSNTAYKQMIRNLIIHTSKKFSQKFVHAALMDEKLRDQSKLFLLCDLKYSHFPSSFKHAAFEQARLAPLTILSFSEDKFGLDFWVKNWPSEYLARFETTDETKIKVFHKDDPLDLRTLIFKRIDISITKLATKKWYEECMGYFFHDTDSVALTIKAIKDSKGSVFLTTYNHNGNEKANIAEMVLVIYKFLEIQGEKKESDYQEILKITGLISPLARMVASQVLWDTESIAKVLSDIIFDYRLRKHEFGDEVVQFQSTSNYTLKNTQSKLYKSADC